MTELGEIYEPQSRICQVCGYPVRMTLTRRRGKLEASLPWVHVNKSQWLANRHKAVIEEASEYDGIREQPKPG